MSEMYFVKDDERSDILVAKGTRVTVDGEVYGGTDYDTRLSEFAELVDDPGYDSRWYMSSGFEVVNSVVVRELRPRFTLDDAKAVLIKQVKDRARSILSETDWMVIRKAEKDKDVDKSVLAEREAVRAISDELEAEIAALESYAAAVAWVADWER